jgi:hypothetical protein
LSGLPHAVEELAEWDVEPVCELDDRREPRISTASFEQRDLRPVHAAGVAERLLRQGALQPLSAEVAGESLPGFQGTDALDPQTKPLQTKPLQGSMLAA